MHPCIQPYICSIEVTEKGGGKEREEWTDYLIEFPYGARYMNMLCTKAT
jgi:hypothetical protein